MSEKLPIALDPVVFERDIQMALWYEIRNEESVRAAGRIKRKIKASEHREWWIESLRNLNRKMYFIRWYYPDKQPDVVGIVRLDRRNTWTEISLAIHKDHRRKGIGRAALELVSKQVEKLRWPTPGAIIGAQNHASLALFISAGYGLKKRGFVQVGRLGRRT